MIADCFAIRSHIYVKMRYKTMTCGVVVFFRLCDSYE